MKRFGYVRDPVCLAACTCYAANRWLIPVALKGIFLRGYFSDLLLIPAALPPVLGLHRLLGLRTNDAPPRWREIALHVAIWSIAAELLAPHVFRRATGDAWDIVAYVAGAILGGLLWHWE